MAKSPREQDDEVISTAIRIVIGWQGIDDVISDLPLNQQETAKQISQLSDQAEEILKKLLQLQKELGRISGEK